MSISAADPIPPRPAQGARFGRVAIGDQSGVRAHLPIRTNQVRYHARAGVQRPDGRANGWTCFGSDLSTPPRHPLRIGAASVVP
jgi:hypothetical protein